MKSLDLRNVSFSRRFCRQKMERQRGPLIIKILPTVEAWDLGKHELYDRIFGSTKDKTNPHQLYTSWYNLY